MNTADFGKQSLAGYETVRARIAGAARSAGRKPEDVTLVAVTKTFGEADILPLLEAGHRAFGENRVQEALRKWPPLKARFPDVELHMIGPLQSNKARDAVEFFDVIQSVDRLSLAAELAKAIARSGGKTLPRFLAQVNTGREPQKAGIPPEDAARFVQDCRVRYGIAVDGLMCIPPADDSPASHFEMLARLRAEIGLRELSMGMSGDYETAIAYGATTVRVGSAIFGSR